jgi:acetoin:2,6-dichlorophenolindophenol oxidoreductase subunit alpha
MKHTIILPDLGQTTSEAKVVKWLKGVGEQVSAGEPLLEVETDKATMEVEAYVGGYLRKKLAKEGDMAGAMSPVAILTDTSDERFDEEPTARPQAKVNLVASKPAATASAPRPATAVPAARRLATELGIDLSQVAGSGPGGLISRTDVERLAGNQEKRSSPVTLTPERKLGMYRRMLLCRLFEDRVNSLFLQGRMPGTIHQAQGQEACAVGVCEVLQQGDMLTSTHRPHEHAVARGIPVKSLMAELFAKSTGCCRAKGGSMHMGDADLGMLPAIAIVGGGIPLAAGYALAFKHLNKPSIAACFFGDGAVNEGIFHETVNMAAIWDLPVVFICENNQYGASTLIHSVLKVQAISDRAVSYGIPGKTVDGNDVEAVYEATWEAAERARAGKGPTLLELETYRFAGHSRSDPGHYRSKEEVAEWKKKDPITRFEATYLANGLLTRDAIASYKAAVQQELTDAVQFAEASSSPLPEECLTDVYVE